VGFDVVLGGVLGVLSRMAGVAVSQVRVVSGLLVAAFLVMLGGCVVMASSVLVVFRCLGVVLGCFVRHE
jgi:hypothetical protein